MGLQPSDRASIIPVEGNAYAREVDAELQQDMN